MIRSILTNKRGVALLMVLSAIAALTVAISEFTYNERINYQLAVRSKERLQAYYLAQSALNLSKVILKYNQQAETLSKTAKDKGVNINAQPIYQMVPLSTQLIRGFLGGGGEEASVEEEEGAEEAPGAGDEIGSDDVGEGGGGSGADEGGNEGGGIQSGIDAGIGLLEKGAADEFLSFDGDFSAEITEEQTKINLNSVLSVETTSNVYDQRKKVLAALLAMPEFEEHFKEDTEGLNNLVHAVFDWVDLNGVINEYDGVQRGNEASPYADSKIKVKNGKYLTVSELRLIPGMRDTLWKKLRSYVTVYSSTEKINACLAGEEMLKVLIYHYTNHAGCGQPVRYDDEEKMTELLGIVQSGCPDPSQVAAMLNSSLGLVDLQSEASAATPPGPTPQGQRPNPGRPQQQPATPGSVVPGCTFQFADLLTADNFVFNIRATGSAGDEEKPTTVTINMVLNAQDKDPTKWKELYYRLE